MFLELQQWLVLKFGVVRSKQTGEKIRAKLGADEEG